MSTNNKPKRGLELWKEIEQELNHSFEDLVRFKIYKNSKFVFSENGKTVIVDPKDIVLPPGKEES